MTSHHNPPASTTHHTSTTRRTSTHHAYATQHRPPARSALSARLALAGYGFAVCIAGAAITGVAGAPSWIVGLFALLALAAVIDFVVVARRERHGEPG